MRIAPYLALILAPPLLAAPSLAQQTWYVDKSGNGDFPTIMSAIQDSAVVTGDRIIVRPGTYFETVSFSGKDLELVSEQPYAAVIDGSGAGPIITFENGESQAAVLDGFIIQNGVASNGGGVYLFNYSAPKLRNLRVESCNSTGLGGGIYGHSNATIDLENVSVANCFSPRGGGAIAAESTIEVRILGCTFSSNTVAADCGSKQGGALYAASTSVEIQGSDISANKAYGPNNCQFDSRSQGGGIYCIDTTLVINDSRISSNWCAGGGSSGGTGATAYVEGGGIYALNSDLAVQDSTFSGNYLPYRSRSSRRGPAVFANSSSMSLARVLITGDNIAGGVYSEACMSVSVNHVTSTVQVADSASTSATVQDSIFWGHAGLVVGLDASYCCVEGGYPGLGNITLDPLFVDANSGDYRLSASSPCIDRGDPNSAPDPDGTRTDMGAIWFDQRTTDSDSDDDGILDQDELLLVGTDPFSFDTDGDGISDGVEYGVTEPTLDTDLAVFIPDRDPATTTDPLSADSDGGGMDDGREDFNADGAYQYGEFDPNQTADDCFRLTVPQLIPGTTVSITVGDARPGSTGALFYSLAGPGPTPTSYGFTFDLSTPLTQHQIIYLSGGNGTFSLDVPPQAPPGLSVWMQAVEKLYYADAYRTSDAWAGVIQ